MSVYEITSDTIRPLATTTFEQAKLSERGSLQRLLRERIEVVAPDTMVLAEEYGNWEGSWRRIDLLAIDKDANLVVIELKRTEDGGHMELQALRYAAMVRGMTFAEAVTAHAEYLGRVGREGDAQGAILEFLGWDEPKEDEFAQDVRIVLVSADFSREVTTTVLWLNERDLEIRCVRLVPYADNGRMMVDVQQIIPLPEAKEYQVRIKAKVEQERTARRQRSALNDQFERFWTGLMDKLRQRSPMFNGVSVPHSYWLGTGAGRTGLRYYFSFGRSNARLGLYIDVGDEARNRAIFDQIHADGPRIEQEFAGALRWRRDDAKATLIEHDFPPGSVRDEEAWPELQDQMIDAMIRFEAALRPAIERLKG
jgi:hypothetical protein